MNAHHARVQFRDDFSVATISPDDQVEVREYRFEKLGIDDARTLADHASQRPMQRDIQLLLVRAGSVTLEAQNALLKAIEDTPTTTRFLFLFPVGTQLLPTVLSRVETLAHDSIVDRTAFDEFAAAPVAERIKRIDQAAKAKDAEWQGAIRRGLLSYLKTRPANRYVELEFVSRWLMQRGASNKMLLEHLALSLPLETNIEK